MSIFNAKKKHYFWGLSLCASVSLASVVEKSEASSNKTVPSENFKIMHEPELYYEEKSKDLEELHVQISARLVGSEEFLNAEDLLHFGSEDHIEDLRKHPDSKIIISKHSVLFKNVRASFFDASRISQLNYLEHAYPEADHWPHEDEHMFNQEYNGFVKIYLKNQCASYNLRTDVGYKMDRATAEALLYNFKMQYPHPEVVTVTTSKPDNVRGPSHGTHSVEFYYPVHDHKEQHTLRVSFRMISIKKTGPLSLFWGTVLSEAVPRYINITKLSVEKLRNFFNRAI
jgi:hypothetical protein